MGRKSYRAVPGRTNPAGRIAEAGPRGHLASMDTSRSTSSHGRPAPGAGVVPAALRGRFVRRSEGRRSALVREDFLDAFEAAGLLAAASLESAELVERVEGARLFSPRSGRGPLAIVPAGRAGRAVVRPYRRGGLARRFSRRRYLAGHRGEREILVTERLRGRGVPVAEPLACVREELGPGYRAALVTRLVEGGRPAGERLRGLSVGEAAPLMRALGRAAARLHAAGGWHADLHADNFLLRPDDAEPLLIDLDRGRLLPVPVPVAVGRWSLRRLARHLRKRAPGGATGGLPELEAAYLEERAVTGR